MSGLDLDELERIATAATRAPWRAEIGSFEKSHGSVLTDAPVDQSWNSPDVTLALIARVRELEALLAASRSAGEGMRALHAEASTQRDAAHAKIHAVEDELSRNGCDCDCDCSDEEHDASCDRCLACRIAHALGCPP